MFMRDGEKERTIKREREIHKVKQKRQREA